MKKLLFITTRLFWPTNSGHKIVLYHYCRGLHEVCGYQIYLYSFLDSDQEADDYGKPDFIHKVRFASNFSRGEQAKNLITKSLVGHERWSFQSSLYFSKENCKRIRRYCEQIEPDVVVTDMIRTASYIEAFRDLPVRKILDMDDLLSKRYTRQLASDNSKANIAGQYGGYLPGGINKLLAIQMIKNTILAMEARRLVGEENRYGQQYDDVLFISPIESAEYNQRVARPNGHHVAMGVEYEYFSEPIEVPQIQDSIVFIGNLSIAANVDTLSLIVNHVMPLLRTNGVTLNVIGKCPGFVRKQYAGRTDICFLGQVEDLRLYARSSQLMLAPIAYGTGIKTKILEAMAMGIPVVTNSIGAEGIPAVSGKHFFVSDSFATLATLVDNLLRDPILCQQVGKQAQQYTQENCRWELSFKEFVRMGL